MSEHSKPEDDNEELSADDIAALAAFEEREAWLTGPLQSLSTSRPTASEGYQQESMENDFEDMLMIFASEIDEDIRRLRLFLSQLEQDDILDLSRFTPIRRIAHKIRGTAGTVDAGVLEAIGSIIEEIVEQTMQQQLFPLIGISILVQAVRALELSLQSLLETGQESDEVLTNLENDLEQLNIPHAHASFVPASSASVSQLDTTHELTDSPPLVSLPIESAEIESAKMALTSIATQLAAQLSTTPITSLRVDKERFQQLVQGSEQLAEQRTPLENAQAQLKDALQELQLAQANLQQQAVALVRITTGQHLTSDAQLHHSFSSLIARVLGREAQQTGNISDSSSSAAVISQASQACSPLRPVKPLLVDGMWDELEVTRYTDVDATIRTIDEAISRVSLASSRVQATYSQLNTILQKYVAQATTVRDTTLLLRLTPMLILVERLQQVIETSSSGQVQHVISFEVTGEKMELDSTILDALTRPLVHLLQTCLADFFVESGQEQATSYCIWLHVQSIGNEVMIELGFSMTVQGGALEMVQSAVQHIGGTLALQRNTRGGVSFLLYVPRTQGTIRGLLIRTGNQQVIVPFSQVQRIDDEKHAEVDIMYYLRRLLDIPMNQAATQLTQTTHRSTPILILAKGTSRLVAGILIDEVLTDVEVMVKPLPGYLQRPGIIGATIDGKGNVQLILNLPELIRHYNTFLRHALPALPEQEAAIRTRTTIPRVLIADDSLSMRQTLLQTLRRARYETTEASDGMDALEQLTKNPPDIFLLDIEMPNLSGYDVLSIMHLYHELNDVKVIMLSTRSSEKHRQHALALGAHAYLTKPCAPEVLLETIEKLLA